MLRLSDSPEILHPPTSLSPRAFRSGAGMGADGSVGAPLSPLMCASSFGRVLAFVERCQACACRWIQS